MRHHAEYIHLFVRYTCNAIEGTVWVGPRIDFAVFVAVTEKNLVLVLQFFQSIIVNEVIAFSVCNGDCNRFTVVNLTGQTSCA